MLLFIFSQKLISNFKFKFSATFIITFSSFLILIEIKLILFDFQFLILKLSY